MELNNKILEFVLSKLGLPFLHIGRNDNGYDCAGLYLQALKSIGKFESDMDLRVYGRSPEGNKIAKIFNKYFDRVEYKDLIDGDAMLFKFLDNPQHIAVYQNSDGVDYMVHAYGDPSVNKVVRHVIDEKWQKRFVMGYRIK